MGLLGTFHRRPFLTLTEREQIDAGLATARRHTEAPIELIIDERAATDPETRARQLLRAWDLPERDRQRAVLVYACAATRRFAVVGGDEIRRVAPPAFWDNLQRDLTRHFGERRYCDGLFKAIAQVAVQLRHHFGPSDSAPPPDVIPDPG